MAAPDANFELMSYNPFTVRENCFNSKSNPDIDFYSYISPLDTKNFNLNDICEGFQCLCENSFCLAHKY